MSITSQRPYAEIQTIGLFTTQAELDYPDATCETMTYQLQPQYDFITLNVSNE